MVSIQNGSSQDFFVKVQNGHVHFQAVMDGHGRNDCIEYVRTLDFGFIASQPDPAQTLWDMTRTKHFPGSGTTFTCARVDTTQHLIEIWNVGDSQTDVFINGQPFRTEPHTFHNPKELERTKSLVHYISHTTAPTVVSANEIQDRPSFIGHFNNGDKLVPSQSMGHNGATGFAPEKQILRYNPTDRVRIVCVSDGVTDMEVDLATGTAEDIAREADRKWKQPWTFNLLQKKYLHQDASLYPRMLHFTPGCPRMFWTLLQKRVLCTFTKVLYKSAL